MGKRRRLWMTLFGLGALLMTSTHGRVSLSAGTAPELAARRLGYEVINEYPHDPKAFLQGLVWNDGALYESTGLYGESTLRRVELETGRILKSTHLPANLFGEGLAVVGERLVQLTWQSKLGLVYDRNSFSVVKRFTYNTEGWGLAYDGKMLVMSDGTDVLTYLDPANYRPVRTVRVRMNGRPLDFLNELEFIDGAIWANVWMTDMIVCIDPESGRVHSYLDLKGILPAGRRKGDENVLNGIAYDAGKKRIFVGGKLWPLIFEIRVKELRLKR